MPTFSSHTSGTEHAIVGVAEGGIGTHGTSRSSTGAGGVSESGIGVHGVSTAGPGVRGDSTNGVAIYGSSPASTGVGGVSETAVGVHGISRTGDAMFGSSEGGRGVVGVSASASGVEGNSGSGTGVFGRSDAGIALHGQGGRLAGLFEGSVEVTANLTVAGDIVLAGADVAEQFDVRLDDAEVAPGWVVVLDDAGQLTPTETPYDVRVAGVVSGAGDRRPGLVLDRENPRQAAGRGMRRLPVAVVGKAWCRADAEENPIRIGDLLTTSARSGHAMRAVDRDAAFGAVIGKALSPLASGTGVVLVLVGLR